MSRTRHTTCTICGEEKSGGQVWFLVAESQWDDKLRVLQWQDDAANRPGIHRACSPAHVEEMVVHWMTMGSLDFPFAAASEFLDGRRRRSGSALPVVCEPDTRGTTQIGELAVHRESIDRVLNDSPDSLQVILDELCDALERETRSATARLESVGSLHLALIRQA